MEKGGAVAGGVWLGVLVQLAQEWDWAFRSVTCEQRPGGLKKDRGKPLAEACGAHLK